MADNELWIVEVEHEKEIIVANEISKVNLEYHKTLSLEPNIVSFSCVVKSPSGRGMVLGMFAEHTGTFGAP